MSKELNNFPRIIVNMDEWSPRDSKQVAQILLIKNGKKSFVNVEIEAAENFGVKIDAYAKFTNVSKARDKRSELACRFDMDVSGDEENAVNTFKLKL